MPRLTASPETLRAMAQLLALSVYRADWKQALSLEHTSESGGWYIEGPARQPCFVEPGTESDCNDFATPGISQASSVEEAMALCLRTWVTQDRLRDWWDGVDEVTEALQAVFNAVLLGTEA